MALTQEDQWWTGKWTVGTVNVVAGTIGLKPDKSKFRIECDDYGHNWRLKIRKKIEWAPYDINLTDLGKQVATRFRSDEIEIEPDGMHVVTLTRNVKAGYDEIVIQVDAVAAGGIGKGTGDAGRG